MKSRHLLTILFVGMFLSACAPFTPYRTQTLDGNSQPLVINCAADDKTVANGRRRCEDPKSAGSEDQNCTSSVYPKSAGCYAIQHRFYQAKDGKGSEGDYYLSFVEFDDQGWFADRRQMEALFALLKRLENEGHHTLIQVYAHGWKHNASSCDDNVVCFSRLLERTDLAEKQKEVMRVLLSQVPALTQKQKEDLGRGLNMTPEDANTFGRSVLAMGVIQKYAEMTRQTRQQEIEKAKPRTVVGVYLGWRGLPFDSALNNLSFWSRKATAERVGRGSVLELLTRLKNYRDFRQGGKAADSDNQTADTNKTQLVITGHSFGGLVIYSALSHALMERAAWTTRADKSKSDAAAQYAIAKSFGDFVMLVNPAFEGSLYEPLFNIATNRCYDERESPKRARQRPVMMIVTSDADNATKVAFPMGRAVSTFLEHASSPEQARSTRTAIGHDLRYKTHDLNWNPPKDDHEGDKEKSEATETTCGCPRLLPTSKLTVEDVVVETAVAMIDGSYGKGLNLKLVERPKYAADYPYLVVSTTAAVIPDHNAIYDTKFITFAQQFLLKHITFEEPLPLPSNPVSCWSKEKASDRLVPSERSCDDDGKSCTRQTPTN